MSQSACIVNEVSELSIALTRLAPNSPHLASSRLMAISDYSRYTIYFNEFDK